MFLVFFLRDEEMYLCKLTPLRRKRFKRLRLQALFEATALGF